MHDYELANLHYSYLTGLYSASNDDEVIEELKYLKKNYKNFPFERFVAGVFKKEIIEAYSLEFLIKTSKHRSSSIYLYGMQGEEEKEKVIYFLNNSNMSKVTEETVKYLDLIELKKLSDILKRFNLSSFVNFCIDREKEKFLKLILSKGESLEILKFLYNYFDITNSNQVITKILDNINFLKFIEIIDTKFINSSFTVSEFINRFLLNEKYIVNILYSSSKEDLKKLNVAFFSSDEIPLSFLLTSDIKDYYDYRYNTIIERIKGKNLDEVKEIISKIYFNCPYQELLLILSDIERMMMSKTKKDEEIKKYLSIREIFTLEDAILFLSSIKEESNIVYSLELYKQKVASEDIVKKLGSFSIKTTNDIVYLTGESFLFLLHKIKGYGNYSLATSLYEDPSVWEKCENGSDYIATSLCNEKYIGLVDGVGYILGFTTISPELIVGMGPEDIYMSSRIAKNNMRHSKNRFMLTNDLLDNSKKPYNEVDVKRKFNNRLIIPDLVFTKDVVNSKDKEVSNYFDVPIYVLITQIYAQQINDYLEYLLSKQKFKQYIYQLIKMYYSFMDCPSINYKYFRTEFLIKKIEGIIIHHLNHEVTDINKLSELSEMLSIFSNFLEGKAFLEHTYNYYNPEEMHKKINYKKLVYGGKK